MVHLSLIAFAFVSQLQADPVPAQKPELKVGSRVPITGMHVLTADGNGERDTCLANENREHKTLSLYSRDIDEEFYETVATLEKWLKENNTWRGYALIIGDLNKEAQDGVRARMKKLDLKHVQVALSKTKQITFVGKYGLPQHESIHVLVYSDKLEVKFREAFCSGKVDAAFLKELGERVVKSAK